MTNLAPIIVFCYNRPWHLEQTLEALSRNELADQSVLYIYCDGPKADASDEMRQKIMDVRQVARKRQWCKEVYIVESDKNKGLANSIIAGVTEVLNKYEKVIVLEDDLLSSPYFLNYMNSSLDFYENYDSVFSIGAYNLPKSQLFISGNYSYDNFVCLRSCSWGWATWLNRWRKVDWSLRDFETCKDNNSMLKALSRLGDDFIPMLQAQENGEIDSWSVRFGLAHFKYHAIAMLPCVSYIHNIGLDGSGTHCGNHTSYVNIDEKPVKNPRLLDVLYQDDDIINRFYSSYVPKSRPLWQKAINYMARKFSIKPPFILKKKVYA